MDGPRRRLVRERAGNRCEYCRLPDRADAWPFHVDHIVARVHGGDDSLDNLSWSCTQCNLHKASNFASVDPETGSRVNLFNPRQESWKQHFVLEANGRIGGRTPTGRATVRLLDMNGIPQLALRQVLVAQGEFDM
jgi:hypothetical protein